eukprot:TRINITY_DN50449_c0_g1_i1.p1 TRINITY_DN50449_c0_g1~~TRINITY_DN50449_c0_g1_i1.p1  ORF type:complete len:202 (-),score=43.77 TRINITY_DN50449_c0_g1_i1:77-649(-)
MAASKKTNKRGSASKFKLDISTDFEDKAIPLEGSSAEKDAKELSDLGAFFGMDGDDVQGAKSATMHEPQSPDEEGNSDSEATSPRWGGISKDFKNGSKGNAKVRRPITAWELKQAKQPVPITISDFGSIFPRQARTTPQESHYEYFERRLPSESPEHRKYMQWQTETTRRNFKYTGRRSADHSDIPHSAR